VVQVAATAARMMWLSASESTAVSSELEAAGSTNMQLTPPQPAHGGTLRGRTRAAATRTANGTMYTKPVADATRSWLNPPKAVGSLGSPLSKGQSSRVPSPATSLSSRDRPSATPGHRGKQQRAPPPESSSSSSSSLWEAVEGWVPGDTTWEIVSWLAVALAVVVWYREVVLYELGSKGLWAASNGAWHAARPHSSSLSPYVELLGMLWHST
jgi:hypothetical protein